MTLDDLVTVFDKGASRVNKTPDKRAGIRAVVEALAATMERLCEQAMACACPEDYQGNASMEEIAAASYRDKRVCRDIVLARIDKILGIAAEVKAAGTDTAVTKLEAIERSTPAADPIAARIARDQAAGLICLCGHELFAHYNNGGKCRYVHTSGTIPIDCACREYVQGSSTVDYCEWKTVLRGEYHNTDVAGCEGGDGDGPIVMCLERPVYCPSCHKPIKFTEAADER